MTHHTHTFTSSSVLAVRNTTSYFTCAPHPCVTSPFRQMSRCACLNELVAYAIHSILRSGLHGLSVARRKRLELSEDSGRIPGIN